MQDNFDDFDDDIYLHVQIPVKESEGENADVGSASESVHETTAEHNVDDEGDAGDASNNIEETEPENGADAAANVDADARDQVVANADADTVANSILTIREYQKVFARQNKHHGTTKIPNSQPAMSFIRQRVKMPTRGRPTIYVAEGVCCQNVPRLLCPGRTGTTKFFENGKVKFVVLGVIWVSLCFRLYSFHCF